jgi:hypothetical protein
MRATLAILALVAGLGLVLPVLAADAPSATPAQLAALREILARPEFQAAQGRSLLNRLLDPLRSGLRWLAQQLGEILRYLFGDLPLPGINVDGPSTVYVIVGVGLVIVVAAAFLLVRLARGSVAGDAELAATSAGRSPRAAEELARAHELAQAGLARQALHHHYRAVLLRLDERDHLLLDGALTNRELLPRLTPRPELAAPFGELVVRFDRLWYGQADCSSEEYAAFAQVADRVWQGAGAA